MMFEPSEDLGVAIRIVNALETAEPVAYANAAVLRELIATHPDIALRTSMFGHLTASAMVYCPHRAETLLLHHRKLDIWVQPGGHADGNTNLLRVAHDEVAEETGMVRFDINSRPIDIDFHMVAPPNEQPHVHLDVRFLVIVDDPESVEINHESKAFDWKSMSEVLGGGYGESIARMARVVGARIPSET